MFTSGSRCCRYADIEQQIAVHIQVVYMLTLSTSPPIDKVKFVLLAWLGLGIELVRSLSFFCFGNYLLPVALCISELAIVLKSCITASGD